MMETKVKNLLSDEKLLTEFLSLSNTKEAQKFLEGHGIKSSKEELKIIADMLNKYEEKGNFLNDEDLENIIGGVRFIDKRDAKKSCEQLTKESKTDLIKSGIFATFSLCSGIAAYLTEDTKSGVAIGVAASSGALSLYKLLKSGKTAYDASWWKRLSETLS